jgi:hypothetical protein
MHYELIITLLENYGIDWILDIQRGFDSWKIIFYSEQMERSSLLEK